MKGRRAFTLVELVMVIALLGIVAAMTVVNISSYQAHHLYAAAERMAADLRYAKNLALTTNEWHGVSFQLDPVNTYNLYETDGTTDTNIKSLASPTNDYIVNLSDQYHSVTIFALVNLSDRKVEFNPHGVPYNDRNGSPLASTAIITLAGRSGGGGCACGSTSFLGVRIAPQTGRVYIQ